MAENPRIQLGCKKKKKKKGGEEEMLQGPKPKEFMALSLKF